MKESTRFNRETVINPTHLFKEVLQYSMLRHLGADDEASLQLLLNPSQQILVLLCCEPLHS